MKKILIAACASLMCVFVNAQELKVASFNIRYNNPDDYKKGNGWDQRKDKVIDFLRAGNFDIFGAQEVLAGPLADLAAALPEYGYVGVGRDDGKAEGEHSPVFYRKDRFELKENGTFWLSETPDEVSYGWDAVCRRVCSYAALEDRESGKLICFFNMHLDHVGIVARRESVKLVRKKIAQLAVEGAQLVITGDFNVDQRSEAYATMLEGGEFQDSYEIARGRFAPCGTFMDWNPSRCDDSRIDHVFVSAGTQVLSYAVDTRCYWKKRKLHTLSDHFPVTVTIKL